MICNGSIARSRIYGCSSESGGEIGVTANSPRCLFDCVQLLCLPGEAMDQRATIGVLTVARSTPIIIND